MMQLQVLWTPLCLKVLQARGTARLVHTSIGAVADQGSKRVMIIPHADSSQHHGASFQNNTLNAWPTVRC